MTAPSSGSEHNPHFSIDDLIEHHEVFGADLFPPVDPDRDQDTVRAQAFFAELRDHWPNLYQKLTIGGNEFGITGSFRLGVGRDVELPTFSLNARGPVFMFPLKMHQLVDLNATPSEVFEQCLEVFLQTFPSPPARQVLRVGLVRRLLFGTGATDCAPWLGKNILDFDSANLAGIQTVLVYKEEHYNLRIQMQTVQVNEQATIPVTGRVVNTQTQHGLAVVVDVNNRDFHEMTAEERRAVINKANSLWPQAILGFLNTRRLP